MKFSRGSFLWLYLAISSLGAIEIARHLAAQIDLMAIRPVRAMLNYTEWAVLGVETTKSAELMHYVIALIFLVLLFSIGVFSARNRHSRNVALFAVVDSGMKNSLALMAVAVVINLVLIVGPFRNSYVGVGLVGFVWVLATALPLSVDTRRSPSERAHKVKAIVAMSLVVYVLLGIFVPFIAGTVPVSNDYMDISSKTKLARGVSVDNIPYLNQHRMGGLLKYNAAVDSGAPPLPPADAVMRISYNPGVAAFARAHNQKYYYDFRVPGLVLPGLMTAEEFSALTDAVDDEDATLVRARYYSDMERTRLKRAYTKENIEFVQKNALELRWQSLSGHFFHHHHHMLGQINEVVLGKSHETISFLYGWLNTVVIAKLATLNGDLTFEKYNAIFYSFYLVYYALFILLCLHLFRNRTLALIVVLVSTAALLLLGFENIRFAPGFNPVRHFFDLFAMFFFYRYTVSKRRPLLYFTLAVASCVLAVLSSKEFGIILFLAFIGAWFAQAYIHNQKSFKEGLILVGGIALTGTLLTAFPSGTNPTIHYSLLGISIPPTSDSLLYGLLIVFSFAYALILAQLEEKTRLAPSLFWFMYMQGILLYYVWNPAPNHLLGLGPIWALMIGLLIDQVLHSRFRAGVQLALPSTMTIVLAALVIPAFLLFTLERRGYYDQIEAHHVYKWDFARAKPLSTMDPSVFRDSVTLIRQFSPENGIFLISKYDNWVPFLAGKYSEMPFLELSLSLVTKEEVVRAINAIRIHKPRYLYVDTDIYRPYAGDVFHAKDPMSEFLPSVHEASRGRALVLSQLKDVFAGVEPLYRPVAVGKLITVYQLQN